MPDQPAEPAAFRAALRRRMIAARRALSPDVHAALSLRVRAHLADVLSGCPPGCLGLCAPVQGEVDCLSLAPELARRGWSFVMPVVTVRNEALRFHHWHPGAPMRTDPHGIPVPDTPAAPPPDVLLLPLVAFDPAGYRLGYGGGYFDRTLAQERPRPLSIGVGFELARTASIRPAAHDIPLDRIVTETGCHTPRALKSAPLPILMTP